MPSVPNISDSLHLTGTGRGYDGVVRINSGIFRGSGVLLADGWHILTVAHLTNGQTPADTWVTFETSSGTQSIAVSRISQHPQYDVTPLNNDLAILSLAQPAPVAANRYTLYRNSDEVSKTLLFAGYGQPSTGTQGPISLNEPAYVRRVAENRIEGTMDQVKQEYPSAFLGSPLAGSQLYADFDNGLTAQDAGSVFLGQSNLGLGAREGIPSAGDSGGPAFLGNKVAGISDYGFRLDGYGNRYADINPSATGTFGEFAAWQRVSYHQQWIDQTLRSNYAGAPSSPAEVQKSVKEGNSGTTLAWFLVTLRSPAKGGEEIQFRTADGSAKAGIDYLAVSDTLKFYTGETHVAIPVEIIGNTRVDGDRSFSLVVTDPVGGRFAGGVTQLTAVRTILDDDGPVHLVGVSNDASPFV